MKIPNRIEWNGFLEICEQAKGVETHAYIFSEKPYQDNEVWHIKLVKTIPEDWDKDGFCEGWSSDNKDLQRVKREMKKLGYVRLGTIHTHPVDEIFNEKFHNKDVEEDLKNGNELSVVEYFKHQSNPETNPNTENDLKFAQRYHDIIRGIVVVVFGKIKAIHFEDMFGNCIGDIYNDGSVPYQSK